MSGFTFQPRQPNSSPVRPKPVTLVGDQQRHGGLNCAQRPILGRRDDDAAGALDRRGDEGGDGVGALMLDLALEDHGAGLRQLLGIVRERVAVEVGRLDLEEAGHQRLEHAAERGRAVGGEAAIADAVIGAPQRYELGALGLAAELPVLAGELEGGLHGPRPPVAKRHLMPSGVAARRAVSTARWRGRGWCRRRANSRGFSA
jgi:hypothetical protein